MKWKKIKNKTAKTGKSINIVHLLLWALHTFNGAIFILHHYRFTHTDRERTMIAFPVLLLLRRPHHFHSFQNGFLLPCETAFYEWTAYLHRQMRNMGECFGWTTKEQHVHDFLLFLYESSNVVTREFFQRYTGVWQSLLARSNAKDKTQTDWNTFLKRIALNRLYRGVLKMHTHKWKAQQLQRNEKSQTHRFYDTAKCIWN